MAISNRVLFRSLIVPLSPIAKGFKFSGLNNRVWVIYIGVRYHSVTVRLNEYGATMFCGAINSRVRLITLDATIIERYYVIIGPRTETRIHMAWFQLYLPTLRNILATFTVTLLNFTAEASIREGFRQ